MGWSSFLQLDVNFGLIVKEVYCSGSVVSYFLSLASLSLSQEDFLDHSVIFYHITPLISFKAFK